MISRMACTAIVNIGLLRGSAYRVGSVSRFAMEYSRGGRCSVRFDDASVHAS